MEQLLRKILGRIIKKNSMNNDFGLGERIYKNSRKTNL